MRHDRSGACVLLTAVVWVSGLSAGRGPWRQRNAGSLRGHSAAAVGKKPYTSMDLKLHWVLQTRCGIFQYNCAHLKCLGLTL